MCIKCENKNLPASNKLNRVYNFCYKHLRHFAGANVINSYFYDCLTAESQTKAKQEGMKLDKSVVQVFRA